MVKVYERINWENEPSLNTPLSERNLNRMDLALDTVDTRVVSLDTTKLDVATANTMVKSISYEESTGIFTVTYLNDTTTTIDTKLEKLAVNFSYDPVTEKLIITLEDGTTQEVDLSALITEYEFENSDTISVTVTDGKVKSEVVNGSITADKLQPNFLADVTIQATTAETYGKMSKSYAVGGTGTREGEDTDNAKYYYEHAKEIVGIDIATTETAGIVKPDGKTISVQLDGKITAEVITYGEDALEDDVSELTSGTMYCQLTDGTIVKAWVGVDGIAKPLAVGGEPEPTPTELTFLVEGAKEDSISITKDGESVGTVIFGSGETSKEVTLTIDEGSQYTFTSSVAKAIDGSGADYSKTVSVNADSLVDIEIPLIPTMTSNTTPSGMAFALNSYSGYDPYKAFNGTNSSGSDCWNNDYDSSNKIPTYLGYIFTKTVIVKKLVITNRNADDAYVNSPIEFIIQGSNNTTNGTDGNWSDIQSYTNSHSSGNEQYSFEVNNTIEYKAYRLYFTSSGSRSSNSVNIGKLQFYGTTKGVKVMPDKALYWYGNECEDLTGSWTRDGYEFSSGWTGSVTKETNYITLSSTTTYSIVGTADKVNMDNTSKAYIDINVISLGSPAENKFTFAYAPDEKTGSPIGITSKSDLTTGTHILNFDSPGANHYIEIYMRGGGYYFNYRVNRVWLE